MNRKPVRGSRRRRLLAFHKWAGFVSCLLVLVISVTGLLLNHTVGLKLDETFVHRSWLQNWYGLGPAGEPEGYAAGEHWIVGWSGQTFFDGRLIAEGRDLIAAGRWGDEFVAVFPRSVLLLDSGGNLLEEWDTLVLPDADIRKAGVLADGALAVETSNGLHKVENFQSEPLGEGAGPDWFESVTLPPEQRREAEKAFGGEGMPVYRILLDLHSGKIFGKAGVIIYDIGAVVFILLAISGVWLGLTRRNRSRKIDEGVA